MGAAIRMANWAEVLSKVAASGRDPEEVAERLGTSEFADVWLRIEPIAGPDRIEMANLRPNTAARGSRSRMARARRSLPGSACRR